MMGPDERKKLEELRERVHCAKGCDCIGAAVGELCKGAYHAEVDILECLDEGGATCRFRKTFGCTFICVCPLRRMIARHFDTWSAESTGVIREQTES